MPGHLVAATSENLEASPAPARGSLKKGGQVDLGKEESSVSSESMGWQHCDQQIKLTNIFDKVALEHLQLLPIIFNKIAFGK